MKKYNNFKIFFLENQLSMGTTVSIILYHSRNGDAQGQLVNVNTFITNQN